MDEGPNDWPPPPEVDITPPVLPAQNLQKWSALILSVVGAVCFFALIMAGPKISSISEALWTNMYCGFQFCSFAGFVLGASTYRHWQGMIAMLLSLVCAVVLGIDLATPPFDH